MDTNHTTSKFSDTDKIPPEQSISTPPPSAKNYDRMKDPIFLTSPVNPPVISQKISHSNLNSHLYICTQLTTPSNYMTKTKLLHFYCLENYDTISLLA